MKNNNYTSFFKTKPKKVERYIRCRKCGGNMEWSRGFNSNDSSEYWKDVPRSTSIERK